MSKTPGTIAKDLRGLADLMDDIAQDMTQYATDAAGRDELITESPSREFVFHAIQLRGAARVAREWADCVAYYAKSKKHSNKAPADTGLAEESKEVKE